MYFCCDDLIILLNSAKLKNIIDMFVDILEILLKLPQILQYKF